MRPLTHIKNTNFIGLFQNDFSYILKACRTYTCPLQINYRINHVLKHFGPSNISFFCNMSDYNYCNIFIFCLYHKDICTFSYLRNTAWRACDAVCINSLNTVYNKDLRLYFINLSFYSFKISLGIYIQRIGLHTEPLRSQFNL